MKDLTFHYIETNSVTLHTAVAGPEDGPLVVLLHGFPEFWYGWRHQIDALAEQGYRVVIPDQRGYSKSGKPEGIEQYTMDVLRDDITGLIDHFGHNHAVVIGHDWGGAVAWHLAATKPAYAEKLIIINIPHPHAMPRVLKRNPLQWVKSSYIGFFQLPNMPEKMMEAGNYGSLKQAFNVTSKQHAFSEKDLEQYEKSWDQPGSLTGMLNWYRALKKGSLQQTPAAPVTVPVRMIWGLGDQFLSPMLAKESMNFCLDGKGVFVGEATHWVQHEQPEIVNSLIQRFLNEEKPAAL
ncbi:alpha/beta fold hydrolase [Planococcus salinus]|uniref:Alpha/beta hydrolase n=1 Tax=Planococcus salinus TaxID=1848460 RepID=A0A3M8P2X0_9BACL|nr:alpha/beta hydrolase [Planococcus salinus]RNF38097.1 alpha/beta hydrolase [Planococcus salinus]